jgi:hypothetical protein
MIVFAPVPRKNYWKGGGVKHMENETEQAIMESSPPEESSYGTPEKTIKTPEPSAVGDAYIAILKHSICKSNADGNRGGTLCAELDIKNVSPNKIGYSIFEMTMYGAEGNIVDKIEQKSTELAPGEGRSIRIGYSGPESDNVKSYRIKITKSAVTPDRKAVGNEKIKIFRHDIYSAFGGRPYVDPNRIGVELAIRNVSSLTIASASFEAVFYDIEGNIIDTARYQIFDLPAGTSRTIHIEYKRPKNDEELQSYSVRVTRTVTADAEKFSITHQDLITTATGEKEVSVIVKNLSDVKADAALFAIFYNSDKENIGARAALIRDIEPHGLKKFGFLFKPQDGDDVNGYTLNIGEIADGINY